MLALVPAAAAADSPPPLAWSPPTLIDSLPPFSQPGTLGEVSCPTVSFCAVAADHAIYTSTDPLGGYSAWRKTALDPTQQVAGISCPTTTACVAARGDRVLISTDPTGGPSRWRDTVVDPLATNSIAFAACPSTSLCLLGDLGGRVLTSSDPFGWPPSWNSEDVGRNVSSLSCLGTLCGLTDRGELDVTDDPVDGGWNDEGVGFVMGFACASSTFCITAGQEDMASTDGIVAAAADPVHGPWTVPLRFPGEGGTVYPVVCAPPSLCLVFDGSEMWSATSPSGGAAAWRSSTLPLRGTPLAGSCPSELLCVITTDDGEIGVSTNPTGGTGAWRATQIDGTDALLRVACPLAGLCVAFDSVGRVMTSHDPSAAASAWSLASNVDADSTVSGLACPSDALCVGVETSGSVLFSTDPAAGASSWTRIDVAAPDALTGLSCPSIALCVATDSTGKILTSTDPTRGGASWHAAETDATALTAIACPSTALCVATDSTGKILTSTDPAGAATTWQTAKLDGIDEIRAVACPSAALCVAVSDDAIALSTQPTGGAGAWSSTVVDDAGSLSDVTCASPQSCVAVDDRGNVLAGTGSVAPTPLAPPVDIGASDVSLPGRSAAPQRVDHAASPLGALLRSALARLARGARIGALLEYGRRTVTFRAPLAGTLVIRWSYRSRGKRPRAVLVAAGRRVFARTGQATLVMRLTAAGRRLLRRTAHVALTAVGSFSGPQGTRVSARVVLRP